MSLVVHLPHTETARPVSSPQRHAANLDKSDCGATSFTADGIIESYRREHGTDISSLYPRDSICISDYVTSLWHDVRLMRMSGGTPRKVPIYGYMYDIDAEALSLIVEDQIAPTQRDSARVGSRA